MNVSDVMTSDISTCSLDNNLESVAKMMWDRDCGSIPVLDSSSKLVGMITDRDIAMQCALNHKAEWELKTKDILNNRELYTCRSDESIKSALKTMSSNHVRRLPVVDKSGKLQGMLSIDDIIEFAQENNPDLNFENAMSALKQVCTSTHH